MSVNFEFVTELQGLLRRDYSIDTTTVTVDPTVATCVLDGEFMFVNDHNKLVRATGGGPGWVVFSERGRFDVQALRKLTVVQGPTYEADTLIMSSAGLATGYPLMVGSFSYPVDSQTRTGLVHQTGSYVVVGYVTRLPTYNGNKLRFMQTLF